MGLICRSRLLDTVPALIDAIKVAGLVLVSDASSGRDPSTSVESQAGQGLVQNLREGVDGTLGSDGVMFFKSVVDA